jgi:hypothetical protein
MKVYSKKFINYIKPIKYIYFILIRLVIKFKLNDQNYKNKFRSLYIILEIILIIKIMNIYYLNGC